ncbi:MAG: NAD(P)/FAD-dependent oxidoreductase [Pseudomonadota bacterium]
MDEIETLIIGAGVVGLSAARALAEAGREVLIVEAADAFGTETSARNSEVIHAGIYYPKDSLKARMCVEGRRKLYDWCAAHGVGAWKCGKFIVANSEDEVGKLDGILAKAVANGVEGICKVSAEDAKAREPDLRCLASLWSPETGIVDSHHLMLSYLGAAEERGGMLALNAPVERIERLTDGFRVKVGGAEPMVLKAREVVNAAGHDAPVLHDHIAAAPKRWFARGCYFKLDGRAPFQTLIYPAPTVGGLGVHLTLDLGGQAKFGPDVEWIDEVDYTVDPLRAEGFYEEIRRYWPDLPDGALRADYAGVRPKLAGPEEGGAADFRIDGPKTHGIGGYVALMGVESPGLTSSPAIGDYVATLLKAA